MKLQAFLFFLAVAAMTAIGIRSTVQASGPTEIDLRRDEVRALEKIAAQLDRINDTLRECRR